MNKTRCPMPDAQAQAQAHETRDIKHKTQDMRHDERTRCTGYETRDR